MVARLKQLRKEQGYSQKRLAEILGITQQAVCKYENMSVEPDIQTLIMLADLFGVTVDYLIGRSDIQESGVTKVILTNDELRHLTLWRTVPIQFRRSMDMLLEKYELKPVIRTDPLEAKK
ncbi:MAG: helix-turn-helix transcriptional regulator [Oscillospiraceae bacterium]|nr:helix-turn-helix transcriptional regulator [Oscillospiraceae bacterium]